MNDNQCKVIGQIAWAIRNGKSQEYVDGMCAVACDALDIGIAPFGVLIAVSSAVKRYEFLLDRISVGSTRETAAEARSDFHLGVVRYVEENI